MYYERETVIRSNKRGRKSVCERERERGERQKKEKNRRDLRQERKLTKILTTVIKKKKKKKRQDLDRKPGQLKTEPQLKRFSCVRLK